MRAACSKPRCGWPALKRNSARRAYCWCSSACWCCPAWTARACASAPAPADRASVEQFGLADKVGVDVRLGRLAFPLDSEPADPASVTVSYSYGFSARPGRRALTCASAATLTRAMSARTRLHHPGEAGHAHRQPRQGPAEWAERRASKPAVIEIQDNGPYEETLAIDLPASGWLRIQAAAGALPAPAFLTARCRWSACRRGRRADPGRAAGRRRAAAQRRAAPGGAPLHAGSGAGVNGRRRRVRLPGPAQPERERYRPGRNAGACSTHASAAH